MKSEKVVIYEAVLARVEALIEENTDESWIRCNKLVRVLETIDLKPEEEEKYLSGRVENIVQKIIEKSLLPAATEAAIGLEEAVKVLKEGNDAVEKVLARM